ncbi:hypothetical protein QFZ22_006956 [Streptomyces canus]|uniref:Peptidase S9 prolyl oligopeptidase catalytic domain-containing protein n=1 Tax=Streptomyces canus TaxID=58343 RepID=A0AAW8FLJ1_9ACTN|nr:hypothetical protein [Streptomyces canus]MDQ0910971.1 hypothetical protein [Streptomyces canus]
MRLYAGAGDTDVSIGNTRTCARTLAGQGARVRVVEQGAVDHFGSLAVSAPQVVRLFDGVRG